MTVKIDTCTGKTSLVFHSEEDLKAHTENLAAMVAHNATHDGNVWIHLRYIIEPDDGGE